MEEQTTQLQVENKDAKKIDVAETKKKSQEIDVLKEASVNGKNLSISIKHAVAICNLIRNKDIESAIKILEEVTMLKRAVPMSGEIPHRRGIMSGRYPVKGSRIIINLLKSLKANALVKEIELEKFKIYAMPNVASRPYKRFGQGRMKRSHIMLKLIHLEKKNKKEGGK